MNDHKLEIGAIAREDELEYCDVVELPPEDCNSKPITKINEPTEHEYDEAQQLPSKSLSERLPAASKVYLRKLWTICLGYLYRKSSFHR